MNPPMHVPAQSTKRSIVLNLLKWTGAIGLLVLTLILILGVVPISPDKGLVEPLLKRSSHHDIAVLIDYDYPVFMRRMWVISRKKDFKFEGKVFNRGDVVLNLRVSHALRSGFLWPTHFSNRKHSLLSSRGRFKTASHQHKSPNHGFPALDVIGQNQTLNERARTRRIIFHKSIWPWSDGCFTTPSKTNATLTKLIAGGALMHVEHSEPIDLKQTRDYTLYMKVVRGVRQYLDPHFGSK